MKRRIPLAFLLILLTQALPAQVDYRYFQSPVPARSTDMHTQAHAITAMLETCLGAPACLSARELAADVEDPSGKPAQLLFRYTDQLQEQGIPDCSHDGNRGIVPNRPRFKATKAATQHWGGSSASEPKRIQQLLDRGQKAVAVNYWVDLPAWKGFAGKKETHIDLGKHVLVRDGQNTLSLKKAKAKYPDFEAQLQAKKLLLVSKQKDSSEYALQAVTVVGYDNDGFWVKGTLGPEWGDQGYAHLSYAFHRWACKEVLAMLMVEPGEMPPRDQVFLHTFALRSMPEKMEGKPYLQLYVVETGILPVSPVTHLSYEVQAMTSDSAAPQMLKALVSPISASSGFPVLATLPDPNASYKVTLRYRCANGELREVKFKDVRWANAAYSH